MRLLKNREAARECRRKKKEYIKCLENRVAVLENQNKALIDELKSLKELYCQKQTEWGLCLLLGWVKDYTVPILGYVLRDASGQCHYRAIGSRNNWSYFGHLVIYFSGTHNSTDKNVYCLSCIVFIFCGIRLVRV